MEFNKVPIILHTFSPTNYRILMVICKNIPEGFVELYMGPISTGLGEMYQYILEEYKVNKENYSITEIRIYLTL